MKGISVQYIVTVGFTVIFIALPVLYSILPTIMLDISPEQDIGIPPVFAAQQEPKAGMIDPKTGKKIKYWVAPMNPSYIRDEPGKSPMGMDLVPVYEEEGEEKEPASTIRIDPGTLQNMGVRMGRVERKSLVKDIRTVGNITFDETKIFRVNTKFSGWIEKLYVDFVGDTVKKGQPLFDIYSPALVTAQEEYLLALEQYSRLSEAAYPRVRQVTERLLNASRTRLRYWDLTEKQIAQIERSGKISKALTVYSPATGIVTKKSAFEGHFVKEGEIQYEIVNLASVWVDVDIYEYELPWVKKGMPADMELAYIPGKRFKGKVLFIYPYLETKTRTAKLRLKFVNPDYELKPGMYVDVILKSTIAKSTLIVPQEAVIFSGMRRIVYVSLGQGRFQPREVTLGLEGNANEYQVLDGLKEGEEIVLSAQFMLDSESRLQEAIQKMLDLQKRAPGGH
ncbi:MAG: efflux RND transporter periplasmic adaptor subunit [Desulfobacterales bacterium]|jgi:Cu(I)/Ag(I) efflux system membrane fusion protein/cobalt-zinc-cadmium efflux system membrane fusion protein